MATSSKTYISESERFFWIFYCVCKICVKFGVFGTKIQSHSLSITENINCEKGTYLNVQKAIFHPTLWQISY